MKTGTIYKICCNDINIVDIYVGSTDNMKERKRMHRSIWNSTNPKHQYKVYAFIKANGGWDNWSMIEVERIEYERKPQLHARERFHIEQLRATLNGKIPTRTLPEYYQDNKEQLIDKAKNYHQEHREEQNNKKKQYYQNHKDVAKEQGKQRYIKNKDVLSVQHICPCGGSYTTAHTLRHSKTQKHLKYVETNALGV